MKITQEHINIMVHARPGLGWRQNMERNLEDLLAEPDIRRQIQADQCRACPVDEDCPSCTRDSQCECYQHQNVPEEMAAVNGWVLAAARHTVTEGVDEWNDMIDAWEKLPNSARARLLGEGR